VAVIGGWGGVYQGLVVYETKTNSWSSLAIDLVDRRSGHAAALLKNGKVLVGGGYNGSYLDSLELIDFAAGTVQKLTAKLTQARSIATATTLPSGAVLVVGGTCGGSCTVTGNELYDPTTGTVTKISHYGGNPPLYHAATLLSDGRVMVSGGEGSSQLPQAVAYAEGGGGKWTQLAALKHGRLMHSTTLLKDGTVLAIGGKTIDSGTYKGPFTVEPERYYP